MPTERLGDGEVLPHAGDRLVALADRPVGGRERREDGAAQPQLAGADAQRHLEDGGGGGGVAGGEQLLADDGDDDEHAAGETQPLQLGVERAEAACNGVGVRGVGVGGGSQSG